MNTVDLAFPLLGSQPIAADHGYHLYAALSRALPALHHQNGVAVHPIRGLQIGNRQLSLTDRSRLILRTGAANIGPLIQIAGKQLNVAGVSIRVDVPQVWTVKPAPSRRSRLVIIKLNEIGAADLTKATSHKPPAANSTPSASRRKPSSRSANAARCGSKTKRSSATKSFSTG